MGLFDKIKSAIAFDDEEDDDSIYEAEMRELERKERSKAQAQRKAAERKAVEADGEEETAGSSRKIRSFSDRKKNTGSTRTRSYDRTSERSSQRKSSESSRLYPPRSPEGSYSSRRNSQASRQRTETSAVSRGRKDSSEISIVKVKDFTDAQEVCDNLINGKPIIVCFDEPNSPSSQRIMDFIAGCVYTINGNLHTISTNIFLFSPDGGDVSGDYLSMVQKSGFGVPTFNKMF